MNPRRPQTRAFMYRRYRVPRVCSIELQYTNGRRVSLMLGVAFCQTDRVRFEAQFRARYDLDCHADPRYTPRFVREKLVV